jgi:environmental stress-induced protein Ves
VRGQELVLGLKGNREQLKPGKILHFPGEEAVTCEVPSGAVADLGFIYDRDQIFAKMSLVEFSRRPRSFALTAPTVLLFVILGSVSVSVFPGEHEFELECGDTFRIDPHYEERIVMLDPGFEKAQLAVIEISQLIAKSQS